MKWKYIEQISRLGAAGGVDGVLELLAWSDKPNTAAVTLEEARAFCDLLAVRVGCPVELAAPPPQ